MRSTPKTTLGRKRRCAKKRLRRAKRPAIRCRRSRRGACASGTTRPLARRALTLSTAHRLGRRANCAPSARSSFSFSRVRGRGRVYGNCPLPQPATCVRRSSTRLQEALLVAHSIHIDGRNIDDRALFFGTARCRVVKRVGVCWYGSCLGGKADGLGVVPQGKKGSCLGKATVARAGVCGQVAV